MLLPDKNKSMMSASGYPMKEDISKSRCVHTVPWISIGRLFNPYKMRAASIKNPEILIQRSNNSKTRSSTPDYE